MKTIEKIKKYYENTKLEVLDKGKVYGEFDSNHYAAVSLNYIHKFLLEEKVSLKFTAKCIAKLCEDKFLLPIPCFHANNLVFCRYDFSVGRGFCKFKFENNKVIIEQQYYLNSKFNEYVNNFNKLLE